MMKTISLESLGLLVELLESRWREEDGVGEGDFLADVEGTRTVDKESHQILQCNGQT